jgi:hypothetical protein
MNKLYITYSADDGFGSQYQGIIYTIIYAYFNNLEYVHTLVTSMHHNYDNNTDFIKKANECMNVQNNFLNISNIDRRKIVNIDGNTIYPYIKSNVNVFLRNNEAINKIKEIFWINKDKNVYKNNKKNVAIHIRRPNKHDNRIEGANTPDSYYLYVINYIRRKYKDTDLLFHIYSQGNVTDFDIYKNDDIIFHINKDVFETFVELVGADILVTSASSFSYIAAILNDSEVYYLPFWHPPLENWIIL